MKKINQYDLLLLLTSILWGYGFVAVANCLNVGFSVFFILFIRFFIAAVAMAVGAYNHYAHIKKHDLIIGVLSGLFLFLAFCLQSYGLSMTTPSNNAFLCSISVIIVPVVSFMNPVVPVGSGITLLFQAYVCARIGMEYCKSATDKSIAAIMAAVLAFKGSAWALIVGFGLNLLMSNYDSMIAKREAKKEEN